MEKDLPEDDGEPDALLSQPVAVLRAAEDGVGSGVQRAAGQAAEDLGAVSAAIQKDPEVLRGAGEGRKDAKDLFFQFATVAEDGANLKAVPYTVVYKDDMAAVSAELEEGGGGDHEQGGGAASRST